MVSGSFVHTITLPFLRHTFPRALLALVKEETALSADTKKLLASINVYVMSWWGGCCFSVFFFQVLRSAAVPWGQDDHSQQTHATSLSQVPHSQLDPLCPTECVYLMAVGPQRGS